MVNFSQFCLIHIAIWRDALNNLIFETDLLDIENIIEIDETLFILNL